MKLFGKLISLTLGFTMALSTAVFPSYAVTTANNGYSEAEIATSEVQPRLFIDNITMNFEMAYDMATNGNSIPVNIIMTGASNKYAVTGFYVFFDSRLDIARNIDGTPNVMAGSAIGALEQTVSEPEVYNGRKCIYLSTTGKENTGLDGQMWMLRFVPPSDTKPGDFFQISVEYVSDPQRESVFTNAENDYTGRLMQAYLFTQGLSYGSIKIQGEDVVTTTAPIYTRPTITSFTFNTTTTTRTTTTTTTTSSTTQPTDNGIKYGDSDENGEIGINDTVLIMQSIANPDKYSLTEQGKINADVVNRGDGVTNSDALAIQYVESRTITPDKFPITAEELDSLAN